MDWGFVGFVATLIILIAAGGGAFYWIESSNTTRREEAKVNEGPRNKALQDMMQGRTIVRFWQAVPPKGDAYMELDDGTIVKFYHTSGLEIYKVEMEHESTK